MEFDPAQLEAILNLLSSNGVEEFEGFGLHVRFSENMFTSDKQVNSTPDPVQIMSEERHEPTSIWEDKSLWPGGKKPQFPGK